VLYNDWSRPAKFAAKADHNCYMSLLI